MKNFLIILLIILIVGATGYGIYYEIESFNKSHNINSTTSDTEKVEQTEETEEKLDVNDQLVQTLYGYVKMEKSYVAGMNYIGIIKEQNKVLAADFKQELKNYLGYRQLLNKTEISNCPTTLMEQSKCADYDKNEPTNKKTYTNSFSESDLKQKVELIFGEGNYQPIDFLGCKEYGNCVYDANTKKYYDADCRCGGTGWNPIVELKSATKKKDAIEISEYVKNEASKEEYHLKYTFHLASDGNYYYYSIEKTS